GACDRVWSCRSGRNVVINEDRWRGATPAWNEVGASLRDYRHMVVNHETGHWLGLGHQTCGTAGAPAAVMQQQSMGLQGCTANPWPLPADLARAQSGPRVQAAVAAPAGPAPTTGTTLPRRPSVGQAPAPVPTVPVPGTDCDWSRWRRMALASVR
ncbi:MAG: DUF3152 domain-containing protein, partial [Acidimicrobiia bacterium]